MAVTEEFAAALTLAFSENGIPVPTAAQTERFWALYEKMTAVNGTMNLTAIRGIPDTVVRHFADCAAAAPFLPHGAKVCDVGAGAGFPTLPLAILREDLSILAVDSTAKRMNYVRDCADLLGLSHVRVLAARAEEIGKMREYRESFDAVTARAVARLNVLAEWCLPLVRVGGVLVSMKGRTGDEELAGARNAIRTLGGADVRDKTITLVDPFRPQDDPNRTETRHIIEIHKGSPTPAQYPRRNGQITAKPL